MLSKDKMVFLGICLVVSFCLIGCEPEYKMVNISEQVLKDFNSQRFLYIKYGKDEIDISKLHDYVYFSDYIKVNIDSVHFVEEKRWYGTTKQLRFDEKKYNGKARIFIDNIVVTCISKANRIVNAWYKDRETK